MDILCQKVGVAFYKLSKKSKTSNPYRPLFRRISIKLAILSCRPYASLTKFKEV